MGLLSLPSKSPWSASRPVSEMPITSPNPEKQKDFSKILAKNLHRPSLMYTPAFVLKIILGNFATELLDSKKIVPKKLIDSNFKFKFDFLKDALNNIYNEK